MEAVKSSSQVVGAESENILGGYVSILDFMTPDEINDVNSLSPKLNHSGAMQKALEKSNSVRFPRVKGYYQIGDVLLPKNVFLSGDVSLLYNPSGPTDLVGCGSAIYMYPGSNSIFLWQPGRNVSHNLVFMGPGSSSSVDFLQGYQGQHVGGRFFQCGFYRFRMAIGQANRYVGVEIIDCQMAANYRGAYNIVDSKIYGGTINANVNDGVNLQKGANDNTFVNVKMEWNGGNGYAAIDAENNSITGGIIDRNGLAGVSSTRSKFIISGSVVMRRNGRNAKGTNYCTHLYEEGVGAKVIATTIDTSSGTDDNGMGEITPDYSVVCAGNSTDMTIILGDSDFNGCVVSPVKFLTQPEKCSIIGNIGIDNFVNKGVNLQSDGEYAIFKITTDIAAGAQSSVITLKDSALGVYSERSHH